MNGQRESQLFSDKAGERIRLRLINAAASSYFYVSLGQESMYIIAADGMKLKPRLTKADPDLYATMDHGSMEHSQGPLLTKKSLKV